jgi:hypothetical protein
MNTKTKFMVALALIAAVFYMFEVVISLNKGGFDGAVFVKAGLVFIFVYFALTKIRNARKP